MSNNKLTSSVAFFISATTVVPQTMGGCRCNILNKKGSKRKIEMEVSVNVLKKKSPLRGGGSQYSTL